MNKRQAYVIEVMGKKLWRPTMSEVTQRDGRNTLANYRKNQPSSKFRLVTYAPKP